MAVPLAEIISAAVAPVFLLVGIGGFLNVCAGRLARIVDRSREISRSRTEGGLPIEERALNRRMVLVRHAISVSVLAAMLVCAIIVMLFAGRLFTLQLATPIAILFIAAVIALGLGFGIFLVETRLAARSIRIRHEILGRQRLDS